ncbi:MAG: penicillin-binding transpeptidase domain-containing protein [Sphingorhabdus sp.]
MYVVNTKTLSVCNPSRAKQRFAPASTYKIPHALLALDYAIVRDEDKPFKWDGRDRGVKDWNTDTSLADAIPSSTVWVFQQIAERLGSKREAEGVRRFQYGNEETGTSGDLRHFWLSGPLRINALEQIAFLVRLRAKKLPVKRSSQERTIALLETASCGPACKVYGKTGAMLPIDDSGFLRSNDETLLPSGMERTGWFVGWVERSDAAGGPIVFAHNLDLTLPDAMGARTAVAYEILASNGVKDITP